MKGISIAAIGSLIGAATSDAGSTTTLLLVTSLLSTSGLAGVLFMFLKYRSDEKTRRAEEARRAQEAQEQREEDERQRKAAEAQAPLQRAHEIEQMTDAATKRTVAFFEAALARAQGEISELRGQVDAARAEVEAARAEIRRLQSEVDHALQDRGRWDNDRERLEAALRAAQDRLVQRERDLARKEAEHGEAVRQLEALRAAETGRRPSRRSDVGPAPAD